MIFSDKNTLKDVISGTIEKDNIHPRKHGISSDRKTKIDKKFTFIKKFQCFCVLLWRPSQAFSYITFP